MCGIVGIFSRAKVSQAEKNAIKKSVISLKHRGPNHSGYYFSKNLCFGHTRLSIIDIQGGSQPMFLLKRFSIVYNGEIINYKKLKQELITSFNHKFYSKSDTEVILASYYYYGSSCVKNFEGMFSFVIYDNLKNELFMARDNFGIKPLYYYYDEKKIIFSSELNQFKFFDIFKKQFNNIQIINEFLVHGYIVGKKTIFNKINKLLPGQIIKVYLDKKKIQIKKIEKDKNNYNFSKNNYSLENLDNLLEETIKLWTTADVDLSLFLSGGVDSSLLAYYLKKINKRIDTYSYFYDSDDKFFNESDLVKKIKDKLKIKNYAIQISKNNLSDKFISLTRHLNEPINDLNSLTFMMLCEGFRKITKKKVVFTGDGSDEIFGGYDRYLKFSKKKSLSKKLIANNYLSVDRLKNYCKSDYHLSTTRYRLSDNTKFKNRLNQILHIDRKVFLPQYLNRIDKIGMKYGIEFRPPFLGNKIVEYSKNLPANHIFKRRYDQIYGKFILRRLSYKKLNLKKISWPNKKIPFGAPSKDILNQNMKELFYDTMNSKAKISQYFDIKGILKMYNEQQNFDIDHSNLLTRLLSLEILMRN